MKQKRNKTRQSKSARRAPIQKGKRAPAEKYIPDFLFNSPKGFFEMPMPPEPQRELRLGYRVGLSLDRSAACELLVDGFRARTGKEPSEGDMSIVPGLNNPDSLSPSRPDPFTVGLFMAALGWARLPGAFEEGSLTNQHSLASAHVTAVFETFGFAFESGRPTRLGTIIAGTIDRGDSWNSPLFRRHLRRAAQRYAFSVQRFRRSGKAVSFELVSNAGVRNPQYGGEPSTHELKLALATQDPLGKWSDEHFDPIPLLEQGFLVGKGFEGELDLESLLYQAGCLRGDLPDSFSRGAVIPGSRRLPDGADFSEVHPFTEGVLCGVWGWRAYDVGDRKFQRGDLELAANHICMLLEFFAMTPRFEFVAESECKVIASGDRIDLWESETVRDHLRSAAAHHNVTISFAMEQPIAFLSRRDATNGREAA